MLPAFLIIGAFKAGTTTLSQKLLLHPLLKTSNDSEPHFFDLNFDKGLLWYKKQFPIKFFNARKKAFESTPYYLYNPWVPQRILATLSDTKFVVVLRNPIERAVSHFNFNVKKGIEYLSFKDAINRERELLKDEKKLFQGSENHNSKFLQNFTYLDMGFYDKQLEYWFHTFDREQFLFIDSKEFHECPQKTFDSIINFVGLNSIRIDNSSIAYRSGLDNIDESMIKELTLLYTESVLNVERQTGINLFA